MSLYTPTLSRHKPPRWSPVSAGLVAPEWQWAWKMLEFAVPILGQGDYFDYKDGVPLTNTGAVNTLCPLGAAVQTFTNDGITARRARLNGLTVFTMLFIASATAWTSDKVAFDFCDSADETDTTNSLLLIYPHDASLGNGPRVWWNGANVINDNTGTGGADGKMRCYAFVSRSATDHEFYVDGISAGTSTANKTLVGDEFRIGVWYNTIQSYHGKVAGAFFWSRALTVKELILFALDPFAPFRMAEEAAYKAAGQTYYQSVGGGSLTSGAGLLKITRHLLVGELTPTGAVIKKTIKTFTGAVASAGLFIGKWKLSVGNGAVSMAGTVGKKTRKLISGTLASSSQITRKISHLLTGILTSTGTLSKKMWQIVGGGTITSSATAVKKIKKVLSGTVTIDGFLRRVTSWYINLSRFRHRKDPHRIYRQRRL